MQDFRCIVEIEMSKTYYSCLLLSRIYLILCCIIHTLSNITHNMRSENCIQRTALLSKLSWQTIKHNHRNAWKLQRWDKSVTTNWIPRNWGEKKTKTNMELPERKYQTNSFSIFQQITSINIQTTLKVSWLRN